MNRAMLESLRIVGRRAGFTAVAATFLLGLASSAHAQADKYQRMRDKGTDSRFRLFAAPTIVLQVNQFQCGLRSQGDTCSNVFNSPTGGGGFWPTGSPNQYMFNSGLQIAGIIPDTAGAGFTWAGDTVGAFFFDASGTQSHGAPITDIFSSLNANDVASWPTAGSVANFPDATALVSDPDLFNPVLLGSVNASQQDSWVLYWDGDPNFLANRSHPMGILVEQRTLAWNFPSGNEATLYFIYKFTNITNNPFFQQINEAKFFGGDNELPDAGWTIGDIFVASSADPDVTLDFESNYSSAILPFNMGIAYNGDFLAPEFDYPPSLFFPPFFDNAPGIVGVKYLQGPKDDLGQELGLTLFSVFENPSTPGAQFFDPQGVQQLWRYLSGNIRADLGDPSCTFPDPQQRRICFLSQEQKDTRFFQASGPFSLAPGESQTVVVAMFAAATVATDSLVPGTDNRPGIPTFKPGCVGESIRPIEVGAGWVSTPAGACADPVVSQDSVSFVPGSLLGRALVAQAIFDNKFLLPFAPEAPDFHLVPGDDQVTIIWQASTSEQTGDPFFNAAGDPGNPLFNPNYRQYDVEGYRVYRGTEPGDMQLVAQFDYRPGERGPFPDGSNRGEFVDVLCDTDPEFVTGDTCADTTVVNITSPFVQFPTGGVVRLDDGRTLVVDADTALAGAIRAGNAQEMGNTGIPFAFVDQGVRNGFQYFYRVTAFDMNSLRSGPPSLESASIPKSTFPQNPATNLALASFTATIEGDDGTALNPNAPLPSIDAQNGTFSGPMPPTDAFTTGFAPAVRRLLPEFTVSARIDSVVVIASSNAASPSPECPEVANGLAASPFGACWAMHLSVTQFDGTVTNEVVRGYNPWWNAFGEPEEAPAEVVRAPVPFDSAALDQFDIPQGGFAGSAAAVDGIAAEGINNSSSESAQNRRFGHFHGGSRWFDGAAESVADPAAYIRVGHLDAVDTVWAPISYTPQGFAQPTPVEPFEKQCFNRAVGFLGRSADVRFTWQGATFGEVRDVTHNVDVPFASHAGPSWGFLTTDANGNGVLDWQDFNYIDRAHQVIRNVGGGNCDAAGGGSWDPGGIFTPVSLVNTPALVPTSTDGMDQAGAAGLAQTGTGFGLYVNGERYIFETASLPGDGTVWTLRSYSGNVRVTDEGAADPSGYAYVRYADDDNSAVGFRPLLIPGLTFNFASAANTRLVGPPDLKQVHTVPDPYYAVSQYDLGPLTKRIRFVNLPATCTIRVYSLSGVLVDIINHNDPAGGGQETWDLRNRSNQLVASGVYFFHVSTPEGQEHVGKFTVVNFGS